MSRLSFSLPALFCPSGILHAGEPGIIGIEEQHRIASAPNFTNDAIRREGRNILRFAGSLRVYPALRLTVGLQF